MSSIYNKEIIEHYKNPRNFEKLENTSHTGQAINSLCGDELYLQLNVEGGRVEVVGFQGSGCAICIGTMSILTERIKGQTVDEIQKIDDDYALDLVGMDADSPRKRCATLAVDAIHDSLK